VVVIDPYDPPHPDGPVDPDDYFSPHATVPWLNDADEDVTATNSRAWRIEEEIS
jgi:hypothetical protein